MSNWQANTLVLYNHLHMTSFIYFKRGTRSQVHSLLRSDILHSFLCPNLDGQMLLQLFLDHEPLKLEPKEKRLIGNVNVYDIDI
jgi:hypothetical protein